MKTLRYLYQNFRQRIEHHLVMTRIGELSLRDINVLTRGIIYNLATAIKAVFIEGLETSLNSGFVIDIAVPAVVVQNVGDGINTPDVSVATDENLPNSGADYQVTIGTPDPTNDRIDIIEGQIKKRTTFTDLAIDIVDPVTQVVTPTALDRDYEVYLDFQVIAGTPAGSPVPPSPTAATAGTFVGTVTTDILDLSTEYLLNLSVGADSEFVEVDMRGATPSATTRAERITALNGAGFGTIATNDGGAIRLTAGGVGENSIIRIKSPLQSAKDAYTLVFGATISLGYLDVFTGTNAWFKISEVFVPAAAGTLVAGNIRSRENKDTDWDADENTVENGFSFDGHRKSNPLDHVDGSIFVNHLDASVASVLQSKTTKYRYGAGALGRFYAAPVYWTAADPGFQEGTLFLEDIECVKENGDSQAITEIEQEYPVNRVDQREDSTAGSGYAVPVSLVENAANRRAFTVGALVNDGTQYYQVQEFEEDHSRVGIYITNGGSISGFTHVRVTLHNSVDSSLGTADIAIADLISVGTGWIYIDLSAVLVNGLTYHYHFELIGESAPTTAVLGNQSGTDADTLTFREMYLPTGGKYGSASEDDVVNFRDKAGARLITINSSGDDDIVSPGDGFIGISGLDIMVEDFSNATYWLNWKYQDYVGVDMALGKIKVPSSESVFELFAEFNVKEGLNEQDSKNYLRHRSGRQESIEETLVLLEGGFVEHEITEIDEDGSTTIYSDFVGLSPAIIFPNTGTPLGEFTYVSRLDGEYHTRPMLFRLIYAMRSSDTGVVKIDFAIYVNGSSVATRSRTIDPPNDTSRSEEITAITNIYIDGGEFDRGDDIRIKISRDNGVGSNHTGEFALIGLTVI
jgi:hypothetical protein